MKCKAAQRLLSANLDQPLTADGSEALQQHLAGCEACRAMRARLQHVRALVQDLTGDELAPGFWDRLRLELPDSPSRRWAWLPVFPSRYRWMWAVPVAAGALALALTVLRPAPSRLPSPTVPASPAWDSSSVYVLQCVEQHASYGGGQPIGGSFFLVDATTEPGTN